MYNILYINKIVGCTCFLFFSILLIEYILLFFKFNLNAQHDSKSSDCYLMLDFSALTLGASPQVTLPQTNSSHLKLDGWQMSILLGQTLPIFRGKLAVSFREGTC